LNVVDNALVGFLLCRYLKLAEPDEAAQQNSALQRPGNSSRPGVVLQL
jgi:hypothetical protein